MEAGHATLTIADVVEALGEGSDDFLKTMSIVNDIIEDPGKYLGFQALVQANKLAALRTRIGIMANWYKTQERSISTRRKKDLLLSLEHNLEENINCLKLLGRVNLQAAGGMMGQ